MDRWILPFPCEARNASSPYYTDGRCGSYPVFEGESEDSVEFTCYKEELNKGKR